MKTIVQVGFTLWLLAGSRGIAQGQSQFTELDVGLAAPTFSSVAWGDYDNDGYLDIVMIGTERPRARIYRNNGDKTFTDIAAGLEGAAAGGAAWADYDNDGDLDFAVIGLGEIGKGPVAYLYRND